MDYTPPPYPLRRRPFRHRPRRSLLESGDLDSIIPTPVHSIPRRLLPPPTRPTNGRGSTLSGSRRSLPTSLFGPDCPFSFQPPKKRKIEDYSRPQAGNKLMKLSLAYCDGGTYEEERYRVGNMLSDDDSVYCTERYSCNIVLQHESREPFTLEWLEIKAPPHGFTSPVSEGVIAVTDEEYIPVVEKISMYGRAIPLKKKRAKRRLLMMRQEIEADLRFLRERDAAELRSQRRSERAREREREMEREVDEELEDIYGEGDRLTEFDVVDGYRDEEANEDEEDKEDEEDEEANADGEPEAEEGANVETDAEEASEEHAVEGDSDGDDETVTPATTAGSMPWPPLGSRRLPTTNDLEDDDNDGEGDGSVPHDCPYDIPEDEEELDEVERQETDGEASDHELRRWLLRNNTDERRRRRRRREEEEEAEREYVHSDGAGSRGEAYMRFQLRDNRTFIVFNPPRYCKYVVLKLWGSKIDNVDIQSVLGYGFFGKRVFPAIEMR